MNLPARSRLFVFPLFLATFLVIGCSKGKGDLAGKVTYNGKLVTSGTVQAFLEDGSTKTADIGSDGTYRLKDLTEGTVQLGVSSPNPKKRYDELMGFAKTEEQKKAIQPPDAESVKSWVLLPDTLGQPATSGLTANIKPGENSKDLALTGATLTPPSTGSTPGPVLPGRAGAGGK